MLKNKAKNNKDLNLIDIGTKANSFFSDFSLIEDESSTNSLPSVWIFA